MGTYTFAYTASSNTPGFQNWAVKTVVTNPDGSTDTVYSNFIAEVLLDDHYDPASLQHTIEFYGYNNQAQLVLDAAPSAVTGYSDTFAVIGIVLILAAIAILLTGKPKGQAAGGAH